jgi:hypothetical protein
VGLPESNHPLLQKIAQEKKAVFELHDEGEITTLEYQNKLDALFQQERGVCMEIDRLRLATLQSAHSPKRLALYLFAAFLVGFFISPILYPKLFGYKSAQECALRNSNRVGLAMCYELYPSIEKP